MSHEIDKFSGIYRLNALDAKECEKQLLRCCSSKTWTQKMEKMRPFHTLNHLLDASKECDVRLSKDDWMEAFSGHPRIGRSTDRKISEWEANEQKSTQSSSTNVLDMFEIFNDAYFQKFGYIYIVCATGKTSIEMLDILKKRLQNDPERELSTAAEEQGKISQIRLRKLIEDLANSKL